MARGWESKSVEEQIELARSEPEREKRKAMSPREREAQRNVQTLKLALARVEQQLAATDNERYREMLRNEAAELRKRINDVAGGD